MKYFHACFTSFVLCGFLLCSTAAAQKVESVDPAKGDPTKSDASAVDFSKLDPEAMEKMAAEFAALTPEHEILQKMVGSFTTEVKSFMPDPSKPSITTGSSVTRSMMGGRYVLENFTGEFEGQKFEGVGVTGFDKTKKKYVSFWFDNMGTGFMQAEGTYDEKTGTMTQTGAADSPMGKMKVKMVSKEIDEDTAVFSMYMVTPEGDMKSMEITYKRK